MVDNYIYKLSTSCYDVLLTSTYSLFDIIMPTWPIDIRRKMSIVIVKHMQIDLAEGQTLRHHPPHIDRVVKIHKI